MTTLKNETAVPSVELQKQQLIMVHGQHLTIQAAEESGMVQTSTDPFTGKVTYEKVNSIGN